MTGIKGERKEDDSKYLDIGLEAECPKTTDRQSVKKKKKWMEQPICTTALNFIEKRVYINLSNWLYIL